MRLKKEEFLRRLELAGENCSSFANRCKLSRQSVSSWVNGDRNPKPANVRVMAENLRCRIEDIAEPQTEMEKNALNGDKFARAILGLSGDSAAPAVLSEALDRQFLEYVERAFAEQVQNGTQTALGKRLGLSAAQINRLAHGKADLGSLPISMLSKLCPDLINRDTLTGEVTTKNAEESAVPVQNIPDDPFLKIVLDNWDKLSFEDRGRLAGVVRGMGERKPVYSAPVTAICPKCGEKITEPHQSGDKFECPKCGQHLQAN